VEVLKPWSAKDFHRSPDLFSFSFSVEELPTPAEVAPCSWDRRSVDALVGMSSSGTGNGGGGEGEEIHVLFHASKLGRTDVIQVISPLMIVPSFHLLVFFSSLSSLSSIQSRNKINRLMFLTFYQQLTKMDKLVCTLPLNSATLMLFEHYWYRPFLLSLRCKLV
jgi:hypothetical protein